MAKKTSTMGLVMVGKRSDPTALVGSVLSKSKGKSGSKSSAGAVLSDGKRSSASETAIAPKSSAGATLSQRDSKTGQFVSEKPGKGITMKESRQRMLKQLDGSFKRLA